MKADEGENDESKNKKQNINAELNYTVHYILLDGVEVTAVAKKIFSGKFFFEYGHGECHLLFQQIFAEIFCKYFGAVTREIFFKESENDFYQDYSSENQEQYINLMKVNENGVKHSSSRRMSMKCKLVIFSGKDRDEQVSDTVEQPGKKSQKK